MNDALKEYERSSSFFLPPIGPIFVLLLLLLLSFSSIITNKKITWMFFSFLCMRVGERENAFFYHGENKEKKTQKKERDEIKKKKKEIEKNNESVFVLERGFF